MDCPDVLDVTLQGFRVLSTAVEILIKMLFV